MPDRIRRTHSLRTVALWDAVEDLAATLGTERGRPLRVLDLGGGTGGMAVPLAGLGHDVTVVDPSPDALAALTRRAADADVAARITAVQGDGDSLGDLAPAGADGFDLVCCHGTLEVVDDPVATLRAIGAILAPGAALSLVVAGRLAAVLARALAGDFTAARTALTSVDGRWGPGDPLPRRFDAATLAGWLADTGFTVESITGLRVFTDLVPAALVDSDADRIALLELESAVATQPDYAFLGQLGSALHAVGRRR